MSREKVLSLHNRPLLIWQSIYGSGNHNLGSSKSLGCYCTDDGAYPRVFLFSPNRLQKSYMGRVIFPVREWIKTDAKVVAMEVRGTWPWVNCSDTIATRIYPLILFLSRRLRGYVHLLVFRRCATFIIGPRTNPIGVESIFLVEYMPGQCIMVIGFEIWPFLFGRDLGSPFFSLSFSGPVGSLA